MYDLVATLTSFSVDGPLVNIFKFLEPFGALAKTVKTLIGLAPTV